MKIPIASIEIGERQRKDKGDIELQAYRMSLHGQLVPIIVAKKGDGWILVAGERRILAATRLGWEDIDAVTREELDPVQRLELELEENLYRKDFSWEECVNAELRLHKLKQEQYGKALPGRFSADGWTQKDTADSLGISSGSLSVDLKLAEGILKYPELKLEKTKFAAQQKLKRLEQAASNTFLLSTEVDTKIIESFVQDDFMAKAASIPPASARFIFVDLDLTNAKTALTILSNILAIGGHMIVFMPHLNTYPVTIATLSLLNLQYNAEPYIWHIKGEDAWQGFIWVGKNIANAPGSIRKVYSYSRDKTAISTREKPYRLLFNLVQFCSSRGDFILEPFGSGGTLVQVCMELGRNIQSYQSSASMYTEAIQQVKNGMASLQRGEDIDNE